jgi:hypothetical protein
MMMGHSCFCVGPQNGDPVCPCQMRNVEVKDGRYIQVIDYGPAPTPQERAGRKAVLGTMHRWVEETKRT